MAQNRTGETVVNPRVVYLWQQDAITVKKQILQLMEEKKYEMSEVKPKIEGARKYRRPTRAVGPIKKEFSTKVLGLESRTFDI